jgi:hypothetical protein
MNFQLHTYQDDNFYLEYAVPFGPIPKLNKNIQSPPEIILELYRGKLFCHIIKEFITIAIDIFGSKIFSIKKSFPRTITNLLSSWMFTLYSSENFNPLIDPFLPNNYKEINSLKNTLNDLVKYDTTIKDTDNKINLLLSKIITLFDAQLTNLKNYKKSNYYLENKYNYKITKKQIIQTREKDYLFYKYNANLHFIIKDKRLNNILDNLLLPVDEYDKLVKNYSGNPKYIDEYIWAILFRYQLLGSNNHQLGVKSDVMLQMAIDYNLKFECFASAINATFPCFSSVYYDLEKYFGSFGSFFNINPLEGTFGLNPPYQKEIIEASLFKALESLEEAEKNNKLLNFIITIPIWDNEGRKQMKDEYNNELPQQNIDYGDFDIVSKIKASKYHIITRMIPKESFTYIDHNFKLQKNKTIQNTYVIIISTDKSINPIYLLSYDFN